MTWIVVDLSEAEGRIEYGVMRTVYRYKCRDWLRDNLSSQDVLWKNDWAKSIYYFAQPQDALIFKLKFGGVSAKTWEDSLIG